MSKRVGGQRWGWALAGSLVAHLGVLALVAQQTRSFTRSDGPARWVAALEAAAEPTFVDVAMLDSATIPTLPALPPVPPVLDDAREGERDRDVPVTVAPRVGEEPHLARPAPDSGLGGGRLPSRAWRRDRSALQARVTDGAAVDQPSRLRTANVATSPQAERREPAVGLGDAAATQVPARLPVAAQYAPPDEGVDTRAAGTQDGTSQGVITPLDVPKVAVAAAADRGQGPLDTTQGARMFDSERPGPARDAETVRSASSQARPGIVDFSRAAATAPADAPQGRGPAVVPGAVARAATGAAANEQGAAHPQQAGDDVSERTQERRYDRYIQEITWRVNRERIFPKALALRLEQGETIVTFVLRTDGRIRDGVQVVKSSGFDEFDREAARAVLRAAPFPPMPDASNARPLPVSLRVLFENPVVR